MAAVAGVLPMTRSATSPQRGTDWRGGRSSSGSGAPPLAAQISANVSCTSATAGPRISTPPGRASGGVDPVVADAQSRDERDAAVHRQHLAVIARQPRERPQRRRRIERPHLDAGILEPVPEGARRGAQGAHPVVHHAHAHAAAGARDQGVGEELAGAIVVDDVAVEMHERLGRLDGGEPCRVVLGAVAQHPHVVAVDQRRPRGPRERLVGRDVSRDAGPHALTVDVRASPAKRTSPGRLSLEAAAG